MSWKIIHGDNGCEIQGEAGKRTRSNEKEELRDIVDEFFDGLKEAIIKTIEREIRDQ